MWSSRAVERPTVKHTERTGISTARGHTVGVIIVVSDAEKMGQLVGKGGHA
jgi:hypothetical protein